MLRLLAVTVALLGCATPPPPPAAAPDPDVEARASALGFLHCAERSGAECRPETAPYEAWAAVQLLTRLRQAVPTLVLARLDGWLRAVRDPVPVRRALVQGLQAAEPALRAGNCGPAGIKRLLPRGVAPLGQAAMARCGRLGLLASAAGGELEALTAIAESMSEARVVEVACPASRGRFFLVLAPRDGGFQVVAVDAQAPALEGARAGAAPALAVPEGVVSPYVPVPEEAL